MRNSYRNVAHGVVLKTQTDAVVRKDVPSSKEDFPIEVTMLIDVLSRIESRRQAKLLVVGKEAC